MVTEAEIADIALSTRNAFMATEGGKPETIFNKQRYYMLDNLMSPGEYEVENGGRGVEFPIQLTQTNHFHWREMGGEDVFETNDVMSQGTETWSRFDFNWSFDVDQINMNRGNAIKLVDYMVSQRVDAVKSTADALEDAFFVNLPAPATRPAPCKSLLYYVVKPTTATTGWNGGNPSGWSDVSGIDADNVAGWKSYGARGAGYFVDYNEQFIDTLSDAFDLLRFKAPMAVADYVNNPSLTNFRLYFTRAGKKGMARMARQQGDHATPELNLYGNSVLFNNTPFIWVPALDADTTEPIYFINKEKFKVYMLKGSVMREEGPEKIPGRSTMRAVQTFCTMQVVCRNRHEQGVICKES